MLKIHCLQKCYNLSDPATEDAIYDHSNFQKFLALDLISDRVPDETIILNFGMKAHIGVQLRGKPLVHSVASSTAKEHDWSKPTIFFTASRQTFLETKLTMIKL